MSIDSRLIHRCTIRTATWAPDGSGELQPTWTDVTDVPCLFGNPRGSRLLSPTGEWILRNPTVVLPAWTLPDEKMQIVGTFAPGFEKTYTIQSPVQPVPSTGGGYITHYVCDIRVVEK